jgi:hypothetical protein
MNKLTVWQRFRQGHPQISDSSVRSEGRSWKANKEDPKILNSRHLLHHTRDKEATLSPNKKVLLSPRHDLTSHLLAHRKWIKDKSGEIKGLRERGENKLIAWGGPNPAQVSMKAN